MNRWLLAWNVLVTVMLLLVVLGGCSTSDPRVDWAVSQIQGLQLNVAQMQSNLTQQVTSQQVDIAALRQYVQSNFDQIYAQLK